MAPAKVPAAKARERVAPATQVTARARDRAEAMLSPEAGAEAARAQVEQLLDPAYSPEPDQEVRHPVAALGQGQVVVQRVPASRAAHTAARRAQGLGQAQEEKEPVPVAVHQASERVPARLAAQAGLPLRQRVAGLARKQRAQAHQAVQEPEREAGHPEAEQELGHHQAQVAAQAKAEPVAKALILARSQAAG
jgi:hypothetical protein